LIENLDLDQNNIDLLFRVKYLLKVFKLFLMIVNVAYFTGTFWMIACQMNSLYRESELTMFYEEYDIANQ
jgi:hypothetical protein